MQTSPTLRIIGAKQSAITGKSNTTFPHRLSGNFWIKPPITPRTPEQTQAASRKWWAARR